MKFHTKSNRFAALPILLGAALLLPFGAHAQGPTPAQAKDAPPLLAKAGKVKASSAAQAASETPKASATVVAGDVSGDEKEEPFPLKATLRIDTSIGLGGTISGPQKQSSAAVTFWPTLRYQLPVENLSLSASITATVYALNDFGTSYPDGEVIAGDLYFTLSHSKVFHTKDIADGFTISAALRVYLPTSPTSQFLNRMFTLRPSASASLKAGPVSIGYTLMLAKYFASTTTATLDCSQYPDGKCVQGRPGSGSFASQVDADTVSLTGTGNNSFYVANVFSLGFTLMEGLQLGLSTAIYNFFGYSSYDTDDELSSANAKAGRSQTDRLVFGADISYQVHKHFSMGLSWDVDTVRPFGADGTGFDAVAPVSSLTLTLVGSI